MTLIDELRWRGMLHDMVPGTDKLLAEKPVTAYIGFDPTADSLHVGNLATVMLLVQLQRYGHNPIALVGGATGMIGDPSGKSAERNLLDEAQLRKNQEGIGKQLGKLLEGGQVTLLNNYDWFKDFSMLGFLREVGKHLTVNYMMSKDSVKTRLETGISFTEFSYQLLQGYDFYYLYKNHGCELQLGGSDQWGNITSGTELIRRMGGGEAYGLTTPLLTKSDGAKFGKSESGNVWLDPDRTSPYKFYQFWLNTPDADIPRVLRVFSLKSKEEIEALEQEQADAPHLRPMQRALAEELTERIHSKAELDRAIEASQILFSKEATEALRSTDERTLLEIFEGVPQIEVPKAELDGAGSYIDLLSTVTQSEIFPSKSEAKKMIAGGGVSINKVKVADGEAKPSLDLLQGKYLLVQRGKKNYYLVKGVSPGV